MIYSTVKTAERATELVMAKANELGLVNSNDTELHQIAVECAGGQTQAIQFVAYNHAAYDITTVTCAFDYCDGDDDAFASDVVVVR